MVDYSKWDNLDVDDDDAVAPPDPTANLAARQDHHKQSLQLIAGQLREAWPPLTDEQTAHLLQFVTTQHRGIHPNNIKRATEIVGFVEAKQAPSAKPLHALALLVRQRATEATDGISTSAASAPMSEEQARRVFEVALCALNTVVAIEASGGARALFDELVREPEGETAERYTSYAFASEVLQGAPPDLYDEPPEPDPKSWPFLRALGWQLLVTLGSCALVLLVQLLLGPQHALLPDEAIAAARARSQVGAGVSDASTADVGLGGAPSIFDDEMLGGPDEL